MNRCLFFKVECIIGNNCNEVTNELNKLGIPYDINTLCNYKGWKISAYVVKSEVDSTRTMLQSCGAIIIK